MYWSKLFIPTLRAEPAEAESPSHKLLIRAGYLRPISTGVHSHLFLAQRSIRKIEAIIHEELDAIGAQELFLTEASEDAAARIARGDLRSYKQLPQVWYQIGRSLECYSFNQGMDAKICGRILDRCGLTYITAGSTFVALSESGNDTLVRANDYAAILEDASGLCRLPVTPDPAGDLSPEEFHTPNVKTIAELCAFTSLPETSQIKSFVIVGDGKPVLALVRGDHSVNETKLARFLDVHELRPAKAEELRQWFGADAGSLGPVGVKNVRLLIDEALRGRRNMIAGANKNDYHLRHVTPQKDFAGEFADIRQVVEGDTHGGVLLRFEKAIKLGESRALGSRGIQVSAESGEPVAVSMDSHRIWMERILTAAVEQNRDKDGMILPRSIAPFDVIVTPVFYAEELQRTAALTIFDACRAAGLDTLLDDRDERPGVKFKDADLIGIPYRITLGKKIAEGLVEVVERRTKQITDVPVKQAAAFIRGRMESQ